MSTPATVTGTGGFSTAKNHLVPRRRNRLAPLYARQQPTLDGGLSLIDDHRFCPYDSIILSDILRLRSGMWAKSLIHIGKAPGWEAELRAQPNVSCQAHSLPVRRHVTPRFGSSLQQRIIRFYERLSVPSVAGPFCQRLFGGGECLDALVRVVVKDIGELARGDAGGRPRTRPDANRSRLRSAPSICIRSALNWVRIFLISITLTLPNNLGSAPGDSRAGAREDTAPRLALPGRPRTHKPSDDLETSQRLAPLVLADIREELMVELVPLTDALAGNDILRLAERFRRQIFEVLCSKPQAEPLLPPAAVFISVSPLGRLGVFQLGDTLRNHREGDVGHFGN